MTVSSVPTPLEHRDQLNRRTYKAILDLSSRCPLLTPDDIALMTGASVSWVRQLMKSDAFRAQRTERIQELFGAQLAEIQAKMLTTTSALLDAIAKRIANPEAAITEDTLLKATQLLLGHINPKGSTPATPAPTTPSQPPSVIFMSVSPEDILRARQRALEHGSSVQLEPQLKKDNVIDVDEDGIPTERRVRSLEGID